MNSNTRPLGWTTPEQSKRLVEAGFDPTTNDLWYGEIYFVKDTDGNKLVYEDGPYYMLCTTQPSKLNVSLDAERDVPCWSMGALLDMMPRMIYPNGYKETYTLHIHSITINYEHHTFSERDRENDKWFSDGENLIANIVDAMIWCLENGYIKKGDELCYQ